MDEKKETLKFNGPNIKLEEMKSKPAPVLIESPTSLSRQNSAKPSSSKLNCLCSPIKLEEMKSKPAPVLIESPTSLSRQNSAKPSSSKLNCLCSPTTHVGSFRCRFHRDGMVRGYSVGSNLSDYGSKSATLR